MKHTFHFIHPYRDTSVSIFLNSRIYRHVGAGAVMLRPVKLNAAWNPRSGKPYQSRLYHMIIINEMTFSNFIVCHLYTSAQFGQNHDLNVFVFDKNSIVFLIHFLIRHRFNHRIRIDHPATALIYAFLQEYWILLRFAYFISRYNHLFFPCFYHRIIDYKFVFVFVDKEIKRQRGSGTGRFYILPAWLMMLSNTYLLTC